MFESHGHSEYYIRPGRLGCLYTLRRRGVWHVTQEYSKSFDNFEANLHTEDAALAVINAKNKLASWGKEQEHIHVEGFAAGVIQGAKRTEIMNFGKYSGEHMTEVPSAYLAFILQTCEKKLGKTRAKFIRSLPSYQEHLADIEARKVAKEEARLQRQKIQEIERAASQWIGKPKDKVEFEIVVLYSREVSSQWGESVMVFGKAGPDYISFFSSGIGAYRILGGYSNWMLRKRAAWEILRQVPPAKPIYGIKGTVKRHEHGKHGECVTELTRVKTTSRIK